jgi:hypothetical protein
MSQFPSCEMVVVVFQEDQEAEPEQDDEITSLLLKHEKSNKQPAAVIPGDESDSDNRSASGSLATIYCRVDILILSPAGDSMWFHTHPVFSPRFHVVILFFLFLNSVFKQVVATLKGHCHQSRIV